MRVKSFALDNVFDCVTPIHNLKPHFLRMARMDIIEQEKPVIPAKAEIQTPAPGMSARGVDRQPGGSLQVVVCKGRPGYGFPPSRE